MQDSRGATTTDDSPTRRRGGGLDEADLLQLATWEPELLELLHELMQRADPGSEALGRGLERLRVRYGDQVYTELIYLLCHLRFEPEEARRHWASVLGHRERMQDKLGTTVDLRVAMVSYFVEVSRKLHNPKIIEMQLFERTRESAYRDELTGLYNYRLFREYLRQEVSRSERDGSALSLMIADVDNFKVYNDRHGHEAGNRALAAIGGRLQGALRKADFAARYGGEEFAMVLPVTEKLSGQLVAERCREEVEQHGQFLVADEREPPLTVSIGLATFPADATDADELVRRADRAMYVAKSGGKNQVHLYGSSRRSFGRIDTNLSGRFRAVCAESHPLTTLDLSVGGVAFLTRQPLSVGALLEVALELPDMGREVRATGHVVHVDADEPGGFRVAVRLGDMNDIDRAALVEYTRNVGALAEL